MVDFGSFRIGYFVCGFRLKEFGLENDLECWLESFGFV